MKQILQKMFLFLSKAIKNFLYGEIKEDIKELNNELKYTRKELYLSEKDNLRYKILSFASSLRRNELHTTQEFETIFHFHDKYEALIEKLGEKNGFTHSEFLYIREKYEELRK